MKLKENTKDFLTDLAYYFLGSILYGISIQTFAVNANFAPGGVSGISIIINHFTNFPIGTVSLIVNIPLVILCWKILGHKFLMKSIIAMVINALILDFVFPFIPSYNGNPLLASLFTGVFLGAGLAIIYMRGSSTGGADFIVMAVKKKKPNLSVGEISFFFDSLVIITGGIVFKNVDSVLYGVISSYMCTLTMDKVLYGAGNGKLAIIITNHADKISKAISAEVNRGSTVVKAIGTYTNEEREMLYCVCGKKEIHRVCKTARVVDPTALVMVTEASEVIGEGFVPPKIPGNEHHTSEKKE